MDSIVVFVLGGAAMAVSLVLIHRYRATERPAALALTVEQPAAERFAAVVQRTSALVASAVFAAILVLGLGGRLMMRLLAATSPASAQGRITDAEEVVGDITFEGTFGLVVFIGLFGAFLSLVAFVLLRRYLPRRSVVAGLVLAGIGGGIFARPSGLIDPENHDFVILSPRWLAVGFGLALIAVYGMLFAVLADRSAARWPQVRRTPRGVLAAAPLALAFGLGMLAVLPGVTLAAAVLFAVYGRPRLAGHTAWRGDVLGQRLAVAASVVGGVWVLTSATQVMLL